MFGSRFRKAFAAVLGTTLLFGVVQAVPASADTILPTPLQVNFQAQTTTTPSGYIGDFGQAYDANRGYGWTTTGGTALDLTGNGRQRNVNANPLLDTFMQMQAKAGSGITTPGAWKAAIANGTYAVTIGVGDPSYTDSHHVINVEGTKVVDFTPTAGNTEQITTTAVTVNDGFINVDATGGTNTKIDFIQVNTQSANSPTIQVVTPHDGVTGVNLDTAVSIEFSANVDPNTVTSASFQLLGPNNQQVAGYYNVDGAYGSATFQPSALLAANTAYTVKVNASMHDATGNSFTPFTSTFTTGSTSNTTPTPDVAFTPSVFDYSDGTAATTTAYKTTGPVAMALGPNPNTPKQLWVAYANGAINVYTLDANGQRVGTPTIVNNFKLNRLVSGLRFDPSSTDSNIKLWVSNGQFGCDLAALGVACDDFTGAISTLTGTTTSNLTTTNIVTGLPRSVGNHMNNGVDFDSSGFLYLAQGAENGYGAPDAIWGNRAEDPLAASILKIDVAGIASGGLAPYNVNTSSPNNYNQASANAKVKLYTNGIRNPFSLVWHSNGKLYAPVNESSNGNAPATNTGQAALTNLPAFNDYFTQVVPNKFYGHPNPARGENFVLNGGNPTAGVDAFEVPQYPVGTQPNSNWRKPDLDLGIHRSADGSAEYKSSVFGDKLKGQILVTEYSQGKDVLAIKLDANGNAVSKSVIASGFYNPLPIVTDPSSGRVYVGEYGRDPDGVGGQVTLLTPNTGTSAGPPANGEYHINFQSTTSATPAGYTGDTGGAFNATTTGFGWENNSNGAALSISGNGRERNVNSDKRLDTLMQMQANSGVTTPAKWEAVVPNGTYTVTLAVGDPSYTDSHNVLRAEGKVIVDFTPTTTVPQQTITTQVTVTDGRLTIDPTGGTNTKIDYIDIVPPGGAAPTVTVTPSGTQDASNNYVGAANVTIAATAAGTATISNISYTLDGGASQAYSAPFQVTAAGSHTVVATATDSNGVASNPVTSTFNVVAGSGGAGTTSLKVNFGTQTTAAIAGYTLDYGQAFSTTTGIGWENNATGAALSLVGNGRERNVNTNKLLDTLMQPQLTGNGAGVKTVGKWEAAVTNGTYDLTIGVGDPAYTDSHVVFNAEGTKVVDFTPTTAQPQTVVTATVTVTDGRLTIDPNGGTNSKIDYIVVVPSGTSPDPGDKTAPVAAVNVTGTTNSTGNYLDSATVAIPATDEAGGSGVKSVSYTLDGGAAQPYTTPFQVNTVGNHTVTATATDNANNTSNPVTKTFTIVSSSGGGTTTQNPTSLVVSSPEDKLALGSRMVFSTVKNQSRTGHSLTLTTKPGSSVNVTGLSFGGTNAGDFKLCTGQATSFTITSGGSAQICVQYRPLVDAVTKGTQVSQGSLIIKSNDATVPNFVVTLGGVNAENYESFHEPDLQQMFDALGYDMNVLVSNKPQLRSISASSAAVGDEVLAPYFKRLDTTKPVQLVPLAHYSGKSASNSTSFGWYAKGSNTNNYLYAFPGGANGTNDGYGQNQLLLPTTTGGTSFTPSGTGIFGIVDGAGNRTDDARNSGGWHNFRVYPAKDGAGNVIPGAYLLGDDIGAPALNSAKNWDYQDYAFLLVNATPDTGSTQPTAGEYNKTIASFPGNAGGIANTGFTSVQGTLNTGKIAFSNGQLQVTTTSDTNTSHTNALQLGVNAGDKFRVQSRLVGPFDAINAGSEQQGIFFGPDRNNYIKAEIDQNTAGGTGRHLTIWKEVNGSGSIINSILLPGGNANTVDLRIDVDPSPQDGAHYNGLPLVTISYAINGGAFVKFSPTTDLTIPASWITANTPAGIMTSHQDGGTQFVTTFANFSVTRNQ